RRAGRVDRNGAGAGPTWADSHTCTARESAHACASRVAAGTGFAALPPARAPVRGDPSRPFGHTDPASASCRAGARATAAEADSEVAQARAKRTHARGVPPSADRGQ